jgi:SNF2 family DNA or RNA helicase
MTTCSAAPQRRPRALAQTKIEAVREELARMLAADPAAKALIFSQFTSMLDLVAFRLNQARRPNLP